jgi:hypothetical protein
MNATAVDYQPVEPASTEGLADLFHSTKTPIIEQGDSDQTPIIDQGDPDHWTLSIAAQQLQVSVVTIRRKLQKGQLTGYKVQGTNGLEWRIIPPDYLLRAEQGDSDQTPIIEQSDSGQTPITEQGDSDQTPVNDQGDPDHVVIDALLKQLANAQKELQAAVWRNGYLEAQLEAERQQVKLLTDSQHKPGWWTKFMSWFKRA